MQRNATRASASATTLDFLRAKWRSGLYYQKTVTMERILETIANNERLTPAADLDKGNTSAGIMSSIDSIRQQAQAAASAGAEAMQAEQGASSKAAAGSHHAAGLRQHSRGRLASEAGSRGLEAALQLDDAALSAEFGKFVDSCDASGKKALSRTALEAALRHLQVIGGGGEEEVEQQRKRIDVNADGLINFEEFRMIFRRSIGQLPRPELTTTGIPPESRQERS